MYWNKIFIISIIMSILLHSGYGKTVKKRGVMDNLNDGLKVAGQMFGINTAADVANLVAKAFSNNASNNRNKPDLFSIIQKGLQSSPAFQHSSEETKYSEKQQSYENNDDTSQQQAEESTQFQTKSSSSKPAKENVGVNFSTPNIITSMLRMVGFDASKLGALAINALIMIASMIGNTLMGATKTQPPTVSSLDGGRLFKKKPIAASNENDNYENDNAESGPEEKYSPNYHQPRSLNDASPIDWFLQNPSTKMKRILKDATSTNLAGKLTSMIENYETEDGQGACLKMLVCKSSPFIWGMQKSIKNRIDSKDSVNTDDFTAEASNENSKNGLFNVDSFFTHLPSINEYRENGEKCEKLYSNYCNTTNLYDKKKKR